MIRADALKSHFYPVRTEITATKQIPILHVCSIDDKKPETFLVEKNLSQIFSTDEYESKSLLSMN